MESRNFKGIEIKFSEGNHRYYVNDNGTKINPSSVSKIIKGDDGFGIGAMAVMVLTSFSFYQLLH